MSKLPVSKRSTKMLWKLFNEPLKKLYNWSEDYRDSLFDVPLILKAIRSGADVQSPAVDGGVKPLERALGLLRLSKDTKVFAIIRELVLHGADPNCREEYHEDLDFKSQALCCLVEETEASDELVEAGVRVLLDYGADVNSTDMEGTTALSWAAYYAMIPVVRLLLERGASVVQKNKKGENVLDRIICELDDTIGSEDSIDLLRMLLKNAVDKEGVDLVNYADEEGRTLLMAACNHCYEEIPALVEFLLSAGADVDAVDRNGDAAIDFAIRKGYRTIVELLRRRSQ